MRLAAAIGMLALLLAAGGCREEPRPKRQVGSNPGSMGFIDAPKPEAIVGPIFSVAGWAIDESAVELVRVYIDDAIVATAPITVMRPDVDQAFAARTQVGTPHGFSVVVVAWVAIRTDTERRAGFPQRKRARPWTTLKADTARRDDAAAAPSMNLGVSKLPRGPPSTSGLGHHPFKVAARVRIPLGASSRRNPHRSNGCGPTTPVSSPSAVPH